MARAEDVELTNMCMLCDGKGNVLVQDKKATLHGTGGTSPAVMWKRENMLRRPSSVK